MSTYLFGSIGLNLSKAVFFQLVLAYQTLFRWVIPEIQCAYLKF